MVEVKFLHLCSFQGHPIGEWVMQSSYSFQALLYSAVILCDSQSLGTSHWVTYCTASACSHIAYRVGWRVFVTHLHLLCGFLYGYTTFYMVTYIFKWLHTLLYCYVHFCIGTHFSMVRYIFIWQPKMYKII
jgi:hypothetical protein